MAWRRLLGGLLVFVLAGVAVVATRPPALAVDAPRTFSLTMQTFSPGESVAFTAQAGSEKGTGTYVARSDGSVVATVRVMASYSGPMRVDVKAGGKTGHATVTIPPAKSASSSECSASGATKTNSVAVQATTDDGGDDTAAIQTAIDSASRSGGTVQLAAGTYVLDGHLVMKDNVALVGVGPATVLKAGPNFLRSRGLAGGYPVVSTAGADNVTIKNLTADQSGDTLDGNVDGRLTEYLIDVRNSTNVLIDGVHTKNPFTYSIAIVKSENFCVTNSSTRVTSVGRYDQLDGIHVMSSSNGVVAANTVDQGPSNGDGDDGLVAHTLDGSVFDVAYLNNRVRGGRHGAGMQFALTGDEIYDITVRGNTFWGHPIGIHDGVYDGVTGGLHDITITDNVFDAEVKKAVEFSEATTNLSVEGNTICKATVSLGSGPNNLASSNTANCP